MFVADENVESAIVHRLRQDGHDVVWIAEANPGTTDDQVMAIAELQERLLITGDTDFGDIVFRQGRAKAGVLLLRLAGLAPDRKASIVSEALQGHLSEMKAAFSVVSPTGPVHGSSSTSGASTQRDRRNSPSALAW